MVEHWRRAALSLHTALRLPKLKLIKFLNTVMSAASALSAWRMTAMVGGSDVIVIKTSRAAVLLDLGKVSEVGWSWFPDRQLRC